MLGTRDISELQQLANAWGVMPAYVDVHRQRCTATVDSLLACLHALGAGVSSMDDVPQALAGQRADQHRRGIEPVIVAWDGEPVEFDLTLPARGAAVTVKCSVELEDLGETTTQSIDLIRTASQLSSCGEFVTHRLRLESDLGWGYHRLTIESSKRTSTDSTGQLREALIISAPRRAFAGDNAVGRQWGCFLPLYALRSKRNWGAGDFTDLQILSDWTANQSGSVVGTLPLLAAYLDNPCEPSPYAPASRLAWNEFYVDVARIPEFADCPKAKECAQSAAFAGAIAELHEAELVDYLRIMAMKRQVLEILAEFFLSRKPRQRYDQFQQFLTQHPHVDDYAAFRATYERQQKPWSQWPAPLRNGELSISDYDRTSKEYHLYAQWVATEQLEALAGSARGGLYLDLPLGVRPDGFDVWRWSNVYALGASAGSPPDAVWTTGQDWCFPPLHPVRIREQGYGHVRDYLAHHLRLARLLRIDHVMQLHRLYWIPRGMRADQGVYVRYKPEEFYAILNLESHRCRTMLIGENLGTVPPEVNEAMDQHGMKRMYVVQYEIGSVNEESGREDPDVDAEGECAVGAPHNVKLSAVPFRALASLNTHDMPTFAAWWRGEDISLRQGLGLLSEDDARRELQQLTTTKVGLMKWLHSEGWLTHSATDDSAVLLAILRFLSGSDAGVILVNLEDLWLETRPQNVPGTGPELPNWRRKAALTFEQFTRRPDVVAALQEIADVRRGKNRSRK